MQRRTGLLRQVKKGASLPVPLRCLLSNSRNSAGYFIHRRACEIMCPPDGCKHSLRCESHPCMRTKGQNKLISLPDNNRYFLGGGLVCPGATRAQRSLSLLEPSDYFWTLPHHEKSHPEGEREAPINHTPTAHLS